ncbi:hypothetical protein [Nioella sp. MMSF_3534]|uniref:hypothetical protein n=1 Tax=Nioella sp. MMSF_3534 TaxID=3046720 RepID=UPI00273EBDBA|nr:hypothetical protein [Nioella sp. MMSF_3534]
MGLDQYAYTRLPEQKPCEVEPKFVWRKHAKLQEFMERLYEARTGQSRDQLNCGELELQAEDIATLQDMVERGELPQSPGGFFFGHQWQDENAADYREKDLEFCAWAHTILQTRRQVFYSCWW